ncbi:aspartate 1-decarboxylase [Trichophyton mentagrophytes]|nr:aspartate 1-decarboxylase [Trichophyton mentagrophytes]
MSSAPPTKLNPHDVISSYFIGPKAENLDSFRINIKTILDELRDARHQYFEKDEVFISEDVTKSEQFQQIVVKFNEAVKKASQILGKQSVPFWSPRYEGHMCTDLTTPGLLGYFMTMIYNPNNVAVEASPLTTVIELEVGKQLAEMFGYNIDPKNKILPLSWGHITCDGTVANLESIWVARNLKFYPLTLSWAMKEGSLWFIADKFKVTTCVGNEKLFKDLTPWELLNLSSETILGLADRLREQFGITSKYLEEALNPFSIQTVGKDRLEAYFGINKPMKYFHAKTRHYSWPKGGAIAGLGSGNMHGIKLDLDGHISLEDLEIELGRCLREQQAVFAVVAIMGSTEEGAADPLRAILDMREDFQRKGLSFLVHADAAWGGYFSTMIPKNVKAPHMPGSGSESGGKEAIEIVPSLPLKESTLTNMIALKDADSITVDPHKAGYIPYPAGSLVYRDGRMRFLVTWTSPYLSQGSSENIGVYGVEGSKPGAAAMATWFSNTTIGLDRNGYGRLLGEAAFTSARLSAHYAAMHYEEETDGTKKKKHYICIPFNRLPMEHAGYDSLSPEVNARRKHIQQNILDKTNEELMKNKDDMKYLRELGSDLNINAFALNWYREDGTLNDDLEEANYFMKRIVDRLSITSSAGCPREIPLYLTSTQFSSELYGECAQNFMKRLHLAPSAEELFVLRNVVMSPFPTHKKFICSLMKVFEEVIEEEVKNVWERNRRGKYHGVFLMRGTDEIFLDYHTSFHQATRRQQIILAAKLEGNEMSKYVELKENQSGEIAFQSNEPFDLEGFVEEVKNNKTPTLKGIIGIRQKDEVMKSIDCTIKATRIIKSRPLNSVNRDHSYPQHNMPFYLYGTEEQHHISHVLLKAPNVCLSASNVILDTQLAKVVHENICYGLILTLCDYREATMQPFPNKNEAIKKDAHFFFRPGKEFEVKVFRDPNAPIAFGPGLLTNLATPIARGKMTLGQDCHVDVESLNHDPLAKVTLPFNPLDDLKELEKVLTTAAADEEPRADAPRISQLSATAVSQFTAAETSADDTNTASGSGTPGTPGTDESGESLIFRVPRPNH